MCYGNFVPWSHQSLGFLGNEAVSELFGEGNSRGSSWDMMGCGHMGQL